MMASVSPLPISPPPAATSLFFGTGGGSGASSTENKGIYLAGITSPDSATIVGQQRRYCADRQGGGGYMASTNLGFKSRRGSHRHRHHQPDRHCRRATLAAPSSAKPTLATINGSSVTGTGITSVDGAITAEWNAGLARISITRLASTYIWRRGHRATGSATITLLEQASRNMPTGYGPATMPISFPPTAPSA